MKKKNSNENIELAEEHIKIAESLVFEDSSDMNGEKLDKLRKAELDLEKAEAELSEIN